VGGKGEITHTNWVRSPDFSISPGPNYHPCVVFHLEAQSFYSRLYGICFWFDQQMRVKGKKVLLLMDNFSAHELATEQIEEGMNLTDTTIRWLPPNATYIHRPLDQGIIQNWKANVKKQFVMFMARTFDEGKDLSKEMHVLRAIRWGISAWENDVTPATIQNCWARSQAVDFGQFLLPPSEIWTESQQLVDDIRIGVHKIKQRGHLVEVPNMHEYISPYAEQVLDNCPKDLVDDIVAQYTQEANEEDQEEEEGVPREPLPLVIHDEALQALPALPSGRQTAPSFGLYLVRPVKPLDIAVRHFLRVTVD
jgi:hypothetical protein